MKKAVDSTDDNAAGGQPLLFPALALPPAPLKVQTTVAGARKVFDPLRRQWVALTPEEWVRQHFTHHLIANLRYPAGRMANEVALRLNGMSRRSDTVIFGNHGEPVCIIEYKSPGVKITQKTLDQILRYSMVLANRWIMVSNGLTHYCGRIEGGAGGRIVYVDRLPSYAELLDCADSRP